MAWIKICFIYARAKCMSKLCITSKIPATNTTVGVAETQRVLHCELVLFRGI